MLQRMHRQVPDGSAGVGLCCRQNEEEFRFRFPTAATYISEFILFKTNLGPTKPRTQLVLGTLSSGLKQPGREASHSHVVQSLKMVELYFHSSTCLLGVLLQTQTPCP
jgi:hypothetical protein